MLLGDSLRRSARVVSFFGAVCLLLAPVACGDEAESPKATPGVGVAGKGGSGGSEGENGGKGGGSGTGGAAGKGGVSGAGGKGGASGTGGKGGASGTGGKGGASGTGGKGGASAAGGKAGGAGTTAGGAAGATGGKAGSAGTGQGTAGAGGVFVFPDDCGTPGECSVAWESKAAAKLDALKASPEELGGFLSAVPKGADLHQHLSGSVYAETYLEWGQTDGNCINDTTFAATTKGQCSLPTSQPIALSGPLFDSTVRAWSMLDFDYTGAVSGHDHFFATFGKFGPIAGAHRNDSIADVAARAASENQLYIETMFNLGNNIGDLTVDIWMGTLAEDKLSGLYDNVVAHPDFQKELTNDVKVVDDAAAKWRSDLGCSGSAPPAACGVQVRYVAQISRTQGKDKVFGQLISAFEMAAKTGNIVAANLSSPEDDTTSINNYKLHMEMIRFLREKYTATGKSPLHITLHAGELAPKFLTPAQQPALAFHIKDAVGIAGAERIGHGVDVLGETGSAELIQEMRDKGVLVEVCLSSNQQILDISGESHPLAAYRAAGVPIAFATDDQGVSRSSMAGEYYRAVTDQNQGYLALKHAARDSLIHAFLPGDSLWATVADEGSTAVTACADEGTTVVGDAPSEACQGFLDGSEKARLQWELERRFRIFESQQ